VPPGANAPLRAQSFHWKDCKTPYGPKSGATLITCFARRPLRPGLRPFTAETFHRKVSDTPFTLSGLKRATGAFASRPPARG
jgi:hypothetical protein